MKGGGVAKSSCWSRHKMVGIGNRSAVAGRVRVSFIESEFSYMLCFIKKCALFKKCCPGYLQLEQLPGCSLHKYQILLKGTGFDGVSAPAPAPAPWLTPSPSKRFSAAAVSLTPITTFASQPAVFGAGGGAGAGVWVFGWVALATNVVCPGCCHCLRFKFVYKHFTYIRERAGHTNVRAVNFYY